MRGDIFIGRAERLFNHTFTMGDLKYLLLATGVILLLEAATGHLKGAKRRDFGLTLACILANSSVTRPLAGIGIAALAAALLPAYQGRLSHLALWQSFGISFFLMELGFYWVHRWSHEGQRAGARLGWLWKIHRTHHSADHLNVSVTMRQNIFWAFLVPNTWVVAFAAYLGMGSGAALALVVIYAWNLLTHTHWRWDDKILQWPIYRALAHIIIMPSQHHSHHGYGKEGKMYRNYAVMLAVYDWVFGTLYLPDGRPSRYGVPGHRAHWVEEAFYPLSILVPGLESAEGEKSGPRQQS